MYPLSPSLPQSGVAHEVLRDLIGPSPHAKRSRILVVACAVKIHFPWGKACAAYQQALQDLREQLDEKHFELVAPEFPFEDPYTLIDAADHYFAEGLAGVIFFHAAYTAGEVGSQFGRWLADHRLPVLSWSPPENTDVPRIEGNRLCCQNFILGMWQRLAIRYAWCHGKSEEPDVSAAIARFSRSVRARNRFLQAKVLHVGGSRVPAFYDGETDELAVMRRFGLRFDRVDLETVWQVGKTIDDKDIRRLAKVLAEHPRCSGVDVPRDQLLGTLRFGLATLRVGIEGNYLGCTVKSWPDLFECYGCAIDAAVSVMNDYGFCTAEEGEMNGLISSLALYFVSEGSAVPTMMDLSTLDMKKNQIGIWHCGASPTRWLREGESYRLTRHSVLENGDPETAVGAMTEFNLATGPATLVRYQSPAAAEMFAFEGNIDDTPAPFRGTWGALSPIAKYSAGSIVGTLLDRGLDHHWSLGHGHWHEDLRTLNHWLDISDIPCRDETGLSGLSFR